MFDILRLDVELREEVLKRYDLPQLNSLKVLSKTFRKMIESPEFAMIYNGEQVCAPSYVVVHCLNEESPNIGRLEMIRLSDGKSFTILLDPLFNHYVSPQGRISLLATSGSLVLFRFCNVPNLWDLIVLNIATFQVHQILVPRRTGLSMDFDVKECVRFVIEKPINHILRYKISYALIGEDSVPRYCCYSFQNGVYSWLISPAQPVGPNNPFASKPEMIALGAQQSFLVSMGPARAVFYGHLPHFNNGPFDPNEMEPEDGWEPTITYHYGRDGWGVVMLRQTNPQFEGFLRFRAIRLFRMREDGSAYDYIAAVPQEQLPRLPYAVTEECHVERNGTKVNLVLVLTQDDRDEDDDEEEEEEGEGEGEGGVGEGDGVQHGDDDDDDDDDDDVDEGEEGGVGDEEGVGVGVEAQHGDEDENGDGSDEDENFDGNHWDIMHYGYDVTSGEWSSTSFLLGGFTDVCNPVFTTRLMLGSI